MGKLSLEAEGDTPTPDGDQIVEQPDEDKKEDHEK